MAIPSQRQRRDAGPAFFVRAEVRENFLRRLRLLGEHELQMMSECCLNRCDKFVRHMNLVRQRTKDMLRLL